MARSALTPPRATAAETVYLALKRELTTLAFAPGAPLREEELALRYGTSRVPVREACRRLQQEGLLDAVPYKGYFARAISLREIRDCFALRRLLELGALRETVRRATPAQLAVLEQLGSAGYTVHDWDSYVAYLERNRDFHLRLAALGGNARLVATLADLLASMQRFFFLGLDLGDYGGEMRSEHRELLACLAAGDAAGAETCLARQIERSRERIHAALARQGLDLPLE